MYTKIAFGALCVLFGAVSGSLFGAASTSWPEGDRIVEHVSISSAIFLETFPSLVELDSVRGVCALYIEEFVLEAVSEMTVAPFHLLVQHVATAAV